MSVLCDFSIDGDWQMEAVTKQLADILKKNVDIDIVKH